MAAYYNQSRRPIPLAFGGGRVVLVSPRTEIQIDAADEGDSVRDAIRSGELIKLEVEEVVSAPATQPVVIATEPVIWETPYEPRMPRRNRKGR